MLIIDLSPKKSREGTSEGQQALGHFEAASPLIFIKKSHFISWYLKGGS